MTATVSNLSADLVAERFAALGGRLPGAGLSWLEARRRSAVARFQDLGVPTAKDEAWHYTNLARLIEGRPLVPAAMEAAAAPARTNGLRLVFEGAAAREMPAELPPGVTLLPLSQALRDLPERVREALAPTPAEKAPAMTALGEAFFQEGALLQVAAGVKVEEPIELIFAGDDTANDNRHLRLLVVLEAGAEATLVERHEASAGLANLVLSARLAEDARLTHLRLQRQGIEAVHIGAMEATLAARAAYQGAVLASGAGLSRQEAVIRLQGEGARATLNGLILLRGRQHADLTTELRHEVGDTVSRETIRQVLDDQARAVFQGRIVVTPGAGGSDGRLGSKALLLSDKAESDAKPELEIFADDVQCAHGATVGDIDTDALFYLRSRGIGAETARALLIRAFLAEALDGLDEARAVPLEQAVAAWLAGAR